MMSTEKLYESIAKRAIIAALGYFSMPCSLCPVAMSEAGCDPDGNCEEQIADVLWAQEEAKA